MRRSWILPWLGGLVALACALPVRAEEVQNSFSGPTGGIRIIDAGSGPKGTFRLALNTEFFIIRDYFVPSDEAHHFAGNLSLSITPTEYLEVFASAEVTSAWDDSNDPMLIQRVADLFLGVKGFHDVKQWVILGGDFNDDGFYNCLDGGGKIKAAFKFDGIATTFFHQPTGIVDRLPD